MGEDKKGESQAGRGSGSESPGTQRQTGDPGRTPGKAEGDRETVEEDLENQESSRK